VKAKEWEKASAPLAEVLPEFRRMRRGFFKLTGEWTAACLYANPSGFSRTTIYMEAFGLPLYLPSESLFFPFGFRVGHSWEGVEPGLVAEVRKSVPRLIKLADLRSMIKASSDWRIDPNQLEVRLGAGVILEEKSLVEEARRALVDWKAVQPWEPAVLERSRTLLDILDREGRSGAMAELGRRREVTTKLLR